MKLIARILEKSGLRRKSFSLNEIDVKLRRWLGFKGGYFIECGANNGISQSNTLYYERYMRWSGLLVEPIPELAEACRRNRPNCSVEQCALISSDYTSKSVKMHYCNLMSMVEGAMKTADADTAHLKTGCDVQRIRSFPLTVPAETLSALIDRNNCPSIDFLSLDVEGYEAQALRGLDLTRHRPRFILVEARFPDDIESVLNEHYSREASLSDHDVLYKAR